MAAKKAQNGLKADHQQQPQPERSRRQTTCPEQAKELVFEHWAQIDALCKWRFPGNENLAHEALLFVLQKLEANDWQRICSWQKSGRFQTFLSTLVSRLLTDFTRKKFGHIRIPKWLSSMSDPIWQKAWRLLMVEGFQRHEAVNLLQTNQPTRERWFLEEVMGTINARCHPNARTAEQSVSLEQCNELGSDNLAPDVELSISDGEILEALSKLLIAQDDGDSLLEPSRVSELVARLHPHVEIEEEDRMFLRLRFVDGLEIKEIVQLLKLKGDPYKRMNKVLRSLRGAFKKAGLMDDLRTD